MHKSNCNNRRNYQKELDLIVEGMDKRRTLLLHACCAPCSSYVIEYLSKYFDITLLYYNPNISPDEEYRKRADELMRLVGDMESNRVFLTGEVKVIVADYNPVEFEDIAKGLEDVPEGGNRCYKCYYLRLEEAARYAAENGFDYFTTTLSISPMKNPIWINEIGEALEAKYKVTHLSSEFKKKGGYQRSIQLSREYDLYRQNFCGCIYSKQAASIQKDYINV